MKKLIALVLAVIMLVALCSCDQTTECDFCGEMKICKEKTLLDEKLYVCDDCLDEIKDWGE